MKVKQLTDLQKEKGETETILNANGRAFSENGLRFASRFLIIRLAAFLPCNGITAYGPKFLSIKKRNFEPFELTGAPSALHG